MKKLLPILLLVLVFSCEDVIDVNLNEAAPKLVIDASINWVKTPLVTTKVLNLRYQHLILTVQFHQQMVLKWLLQIQTITRLTLSKTELPEFITTLLLFPSLTKRIP